MHRAVLGPESSGDLESRFGGSLLERSRELRALGFLRGRSPTQLLLPGFPGDLSGRLLITLLGLALSGLRHDLR